MQAFQTHTAAQPISIQSLQTQQKPRVTEAQHNAEKHSLLNSHVLSYVPSNASASIEFNTEDLIISCIVIESELRSVYVIVVSFIR